MGKPSNSCLKIITCGGAGDSSDNEELAPSETKSSSDKRRWSFRKKPVGHRVLSNSVTSEQVSAAYNKETLETTPATFDSPIHLSIPEKTHAEDKQRETHHPLPPEVFNSEETYTQVSDRNTSLDDNKQDSVAVVIQASVRRYLAQKELVKLKNVVKLQSAIRGHLVRREAVETLWCAQAIVKIQALVRVRLACQSVQKSAAKEVKKPESALLGKGKGRITHSSIQILLSNGFAQQLLESMPKTKNFHIKCDSSRSDSSWRWLERWMTVTSSSIEGHKLHRDNQEVLEEDANPATRGLSNEVPATQASAKQDADGDLMNNTFGSFEFKAPFNCSSSAEKFEEDEDQFFGAIKSNHTKTEVIAVQESSFCFSDHKPLHSHENEISQPLCDVESEIEINASEKQDDRREPSETEGKRFAFGSRRTCNPAFIAAQSKFEELSSAQSVSRSIQSKSDSIHSHVNALSMKTKDQTLLENSTADSRIQMASSECGTEISISSTLDSPDRSEAEGGEIVLEIGPVEKENYAANSGDGNMFTHETNPNAEANNWTQTYTESDGNKAGLIGLGDSVVQVEKQQIEFHSSELQTHLENMRSDQPVYRSSPEGSPRSHATALESHGTPSSQISVGAKKSKKDSNMPTRKHKSQTAVTRSPSTPNSDSSIKEQKSKDTKNGKKRSSLPAVPKPDTVEHEPRISSSNSLPSYMQATKSARAKAHAGISPKSSPDTNDKDHLQKRHSLPMSNGKQDSSPRMQRSTSQAQNVKGNATHSPHNSAERRWQR